MQAIFNEARKINKEPKKTQYKMTIKPQTTCNDILEMILSSVVEGKFLDRSSEKVLQIHAEIEKLPASSRDEALELRAVLLHVCGDLDGSLRALGQREHKNLLKDLNILANYSRCSAGQAIFAKICGPKNGVFWSSILYAVGLGAFRQVASFAREAEKMRLSNENIDAGSLTLEEIFMIDEVLTELDITDARAGQVMEVAGRVLEGHGYMFLGAGPEVEILGDEDDRRSLHLTYRLATSSTEAVNMYMDFIDALFDQDLDMPIGFHVSFGGIRA